MVDDPLTPAQIKALDHALRNHYIVARDGIRTICDCGWNGPPGTTSWEWSRHRLDKIVDAINKAGDAE